MPVWHTDNMSMFQRLDRRLRGERGLGKRICSQACRHPERKRRRSSV